MKVLILIAFFCGNVFKNCQGQCFCDPPPNIPNGSPDRRSHVEVGDTVSYSCDSGYFLFGTDATCQAPSDTSGGFCDFGFWVNVPSCIAECDPPPTIDNGAFGLPSANYIQGATVTYSCGTGYQLSGPATATCMSNRQWSTIPSCLAVCGAPPSIPNGSHGPPTGIIEGEMVTYSCNSGYQLSESATATCNSDGNWSPIPTCLAMCYPPPVITHGSPGTPTSSLQGGTVTYSCDQGYHLSGSDTATCMNDRFWSPIPSCLAICGPPPSIPNGTPGTPTGMLERDMVTYRCNSNYQLSGPATATCGSDRNWSPIPSCLADCGPPPSIPNGTPGTPTGMLERDTVTYRCNSNYQLSGPATATCGSDQNWSPIPSCLAYCGPPPSIPNGSSGAPTSTVQGGMVTYSCDSGYQLSGSATVTCGSDGIWRQVPTCLAICGLPPSISNGSSGTPTSVVEGGMVTYSCENGFELVGLEVVTCQPTGSWEPVPSCTDTIIPCGSPPSIPNGSVGTPTSLNLGGTVDYSCDTGYILLGYATASCQADGNWRPIPTCAADCGPPPSIANGRAVSSTGTLEMDTVTYSCDNGYEVNGSDTITCQTDGNWTPEPTCSATLEAISIEIESSGAFPMFSQSFSLTCRILEAEPFRPSFSYRWKIDGQFLQVSTPTLSFDALDLSDTGEYTCEVIVSSEMWTESRMYNESYGIHFSVLSFQLRINGISQCRDYTSSGSAQKTQDIIRRLVSGVNDVCDCNFNSSFISEAFLRCFDSSPNHVTFRAKLSGTDQLFSEDLILSIKKWVNSTEMIIIDNLQLSVDSCCPVVIEDFSSPECSCDVTTDPSRAPLQVEHIIAIAVVAGVLVILLIIIIATVIIIRQRKKPAEKSNKKHTGNGNSILLHSNYLNTGPHYEDPDELMSNSEYEDMDPPPPLPMTRTGDNPAYVSSPVHVGSAQ